MKEIAMKLFRLVSKPDLGVFYPLIVPSAIALVFLSLFITGIFCYRVKRADKTSILALTLCVYTLSVIKTICDLISKPIKQGFVLSCIGGLFMSALSFAFYGILCLQYNARLKLNMREKRLIDRLSRSDDEKTDGFKGGFDDKFLSGENDLEPSLVKRAFSGSRFGSPFDTPVKRVERLGTFKETFKAGGEGDGSGESDVTRYGINFCEILGYLENLKRHELTADEKALVFSLETKAESYSSRRISCEERKEFSSELLQLIKLVSKYKAS